MNAKAAIIAFCLGTTPLTASVTYEVLAEYAPPGPATPRRILAFDGTYYYGMSQDGGLAGGGSIYRINATTFVLEVLRSFDGGANGSSPAGSPLLASDGLLYGTTYAGGANDDGVLFQMEKDGSNFMVLRDFENLSGRQPNGTLIEGADGRLYGVNSLGTIFGNGNIFAINKNGTGYTTLLTFTGMAGVNPGGGGDGGSQPLIQLSDGKLYGATQFGGTENRGVVFRLDPNGDNYEVLHQFTSAEPNRPSDGLTAASDGFLYGVTNQGGTGASGGVYRILPNGAGYQVLHHFDGGPNGGAGFQRVVEGSDGFLYGVVFGHGNPSVGYLFRMSRDGSTFAIVHQFSSAEGSQPTSTPLEVSPGVFLGTTFGGGTTGDGVLYRLSTVLEAPTIQANGKRKRKVSSNKRKIRVSGIASDDLAVARVEYRTRGGWRPVAGASNWTQRITLKNGRKTMISFRAFDGDGLLSNIAQVRVKRKK